MSDNPETQFVPFSNRPDKKGPKTIAIVLFFGAISMILMGFGDLQNSSRDDYLNAETQIKPHQDQDVNVTVEEYQIYHDELKKDGAYTVRGISFSAGGLLVLVGSILLYKLKSIGAKLSVSGAVIGLGGGYYGTRMMSKVAEDFLPEEMVLITELWSYIAATCMTICLALAVLPLINSSARLALDQKVTLVIEEE